MKKSKKHMVLFIILGTILLVCIMIYFISNINYKKNINKKDEKLIFEIQYLENQLFKMNNLLKSNTIIQWDTLEEKREKIYTYWTSAILDFNQLNIEKNHLTEFGKKLDEIAVLIKTRNTQEIRNSIIQLYKMLTVFINPLNDQNEKNLLQVRYHLIRCSFYAEQGNWTEVQENILKSDEYMSKIVNNIEKLNSNQYNLNQAFVAIKELENTINTKDSDLFYWKYTIAIDKLNML